MKRIRVHVCALDHECRADLAGLGGAPWRLDVDVPNHWHLTVALRPQDRMVRVKPDGTYVAHWWYWRSWRSTRPTAG